MASGDPVTQEDKITARELRRLADELDPPEDRATRIAKRLYATESDLSETWVQKAERILREEGV